TCSTIHFEQNAGNLVAIGIPHHHVVVAHDSGLRDLVERRALRQSRQREMGGVAAGLGRCWRRCRDSARFAGGRPWSPLWTLHAALAGRRASRGVEVVGQTHPVRDFHDLLFDPGSRDAPGPHWTDALDLAQALWLGLDNIEYFVAENARQLLGVDRTDAA